jgi:hypothetical protein
VERLAGRLAARRFESELREHELAGPGPQVVHPDHHADVAGPLQRELGVEQLQHFARVAARTPAVVHDPRWIALAAQDALELRRIGRVLDRRAAQPVGERITQAQHGSLGRCRALRRWLSVDIPAPERKCLQRQLEQDERHRGDAERLEQPLHSPAARMIGRALPRFCCDRCRR